jgi:predicted esterase
MRFLVMTKVEKLEKEVQGLSRSELEAFREWFREYDSEEWDRQIEKDVRAGKLDKFAEEALAEHNAGKSKEL